MEYMKGVPDKFFDLAIVDPEYGIGRSGQTETFTKNPKHKRKYFEDKGWDNKRQDLGYWEELFRVSKNQIIWGANYFTEFLPPSMGWIFWDKGQDLSMSDGELAFTSFERALRRVKINRGQLMVEGGTIHPTQKPEKLYRWILHNYAKEGDKIFDSHLGSGSIAIACHDMKFDLVGCEIDKDYYRKIKGVHESWQGIYKRIKDSKMVFERTLCLFKKVGGLAGVEQGKEIGDLEGGKR
jgi:site-specific DNA-methyltransferase (adenine-specific)